MARVATITGVNAFRVLVTSAQRRGEVFAPIHWSDRHATGGRAGILSADHVDPISGQPGLKLTPASIAKVGVDWHGFVLSRKPVSVPACLWSVSAPVPAGTLLEIAGYGDLPSVDIPRGERVEALDKARGTRRIAVLEDGRLAFALFLTKDGTLPARDWLMQQLGQPIGTAAALAGRPPSAEAACEPAVCLCFNIGATAIRSAVAKGELTDVAGIGRATGAGTNCGSCRPALARLLSQAQVNVHAAE